MGAEFSAFFANTAGSGTSSLVIGGATPTPISGGVAGRMLWDTGTTIDETDGLSWSATNKALTLGGATVTTSNPILNLTQTWNAGAVTFTGIDLNVTNTASAAASLLMNLKTGGATMFSVTRAGVVAATGAISGTTVTGSSAVITAGAAGFFSFSSRANLNSPADGQLSIRDTATTSLGVIQVNWGGATTAFPALVRPALSTTLQARLGDNSAFTFLQGKLQTDTAYTAGSAGAATGYLVMYDSAGTAYKVEARV